MRENKTLKSIKIRKLMVKDVPQIVGIQEAITKAKVSPKKKAILKEHIQKEGNISVVALREGQILGFIISEIMTNSFGIDQGGWIQNLGVDPKHMGEGIGQTLATSSIRGLQEKENT